VVVQDSMGFVIAVASLDPTAMISDTLKNGGSSKGAKVVEANGGSSEGAKVVEVSGGANASKGTVPGPFKKSTSSLMGVSPVKTLPVPQEVVVQTPQKKRTVADVLKELRDLKEQSGLSGLGRATEIAKRLNLFAVNKPNMHKEVLAYVSELERALIDASKDFKSLEDKIHKQTDEISGAVVPPPAPSKRSRTPQESPQHPKGKKSRVDATNLLTDEGGSGSTFVPPRKKPKEGVSVRPPRQKEPKKGVRPKADALMIEAKEPQSYAEILSKVKKDPSLKELGTLVARVRRTKTGEMLLELKNDPCVKSEPFKDILTKSLGGLASVRALSQQVVVECLHIDEVTTEKELRDALQEQFPAGDLGKSASIRMRKAFGGTQIASLKLPVAHANELMERGKIRVGWTICPLRLPDRRLSRCYKCLSFGHVASRCTGTDRSNRCWKCGLEGHVVKNCRNKPKCMLCADGENDHSTRSLKCKTFLEAKARVTHR
jgi:hypothetical protein